ncbi:ABC transporter permease [Fictibacillus macauensis]|nr:ABC transporter permease [Fictibacillus macauensis]
MFLAWKEMKHAKARFILIGFIMVLLAYLVLFVSGLANGLQADNVSSIQHMKATSFVVAQNSDQRLQSSQLTEKQWHELQRTKDVTPLGLRMTSVKQQGSQKKIDSTLMAIDPEQFLAPTIEEGQAVTHLRPNEVVGDYSLKEHGFMLGDVLVETMTGKTMTLVGFTKNELFSHAPVLHMTTQGWHRLFGAKVSWNAGALRTAVHLPSIKGVEQASKEEIVQSVPGYKEEQGSLTMMIVFLFVISAFVLSVFFYVLTLQKMSHFGVLKAMGATTRYLARSILYQVLLLTSFSVAIGVGLTLLTGALLPSTMPFHVTPTLLLSCCGLLITVAILGSLLSLNTVRKVDAIEAIGRAN